MKNRDAIIMVRNAVFHGEDFSLDLPDSDCRVQGREAAFRDANYHVFKAVKGNAMKIGVTHESENMLEVREAEVEALRRYRAKMDALFGRVHELLDMWHSECVGDDYVYARLRELTGKAEEQ